MLERSFDADAVANALGIPSSKTIIRRHLTTELNALIRPARYKSIYSVGSGGGVWDYPDLVPEGIMVEMEV